MSQSAPERRRQPMKRRAWVELLVGICLLAVGMVFFVLFRPPLRIPRPNRSRSLETDERRHLDELNRQALQQLTNGNFALAERDLAKIAWSARSEPLGLQNLAVCRLLALEAGQGEAQIALETVNQFVDAYPESAVACLLAARAHMLLMRVASNDLRREQHRAMAEAYHTRASILDGSDMVTFYGLYEACLASEELETKKRGIEALASAYRISPENLFLSVTWIAELSAMRDTRVTNALQTARSLLSPLHEGVRDRMGVDVFELIDQATQASLAGHWQTVATNVRATRDAVRYEEYVQSDRRRAYPHLLAFAVRRFSDEFYARFPQVAQTEKPASSVRFEALEPGLQPPPLPAVRDLLVVDADSDGAADLAVLCPGEFLLLRRGSAGAWDVALRQPVPEKLDRMMCGVLDRDRPFAPAATVAKPGRLPPAARPAGQRAVRPRDPDFVLYGEAGVFVLRYDGPAAGQHPATLQIQQPQSLASLAHVTAAVLVDLDHDGDLDLVAAGQQGISVWNNGGKLRFAELSSRSRLPVPESRVQQMIAVDWDRDADLDVLYAASANEVSGWLENLRYGEGRWQPFKWRMSGMPVHANSVAAVETDGDACWELLVVGVGGVRLIRTAVGAPGGMRLGDETVVAESLHRLLDTWDFDNDGRIDLLAITDEGIAVYRGTATRGFQPAEDIFPDPPSSTVTAGRSADFDGDGDLDVAFATSEGVVVYANQGGDRNRRLAVRWQGGGARVNPLGIGSLVEVRGQGYQAQHISQPVTHFGLDQEGPVEVRVVSTDGAAQTVIDPQSDDLLWEHSSPGAKGLCLFARTGNRFRFVGNLFPEAIGSPGARALPASSHGLGITPPPAVLRGGVELCLTAESWAAGYLDHLRLTVIDRPADVQVLLPQGISAPSLGESFLEAALEESGAECRTARLRLRAAELRYRGFSKPLAAQGSKPRGFDYHARTAEPRWPPMRGRFTRYGDVRPLLETADDRLVVMGAGDEIWLRFDPPSDPLPDRWRRDLALHAVGWTKSGDPTSIYGRSSEPLPFRAMQRYPYLAAEPSVSDRRVDEYLNAYQTRRQQLWSFWSR